MRSKDLLLFAFYFGLSTILTWWFVVLCPLYIRDEQMLLSTGIAGGKWAIQIFLGLIFLKEKSFEFLKRIGFVCFIGSCILIPYIIFSWLGFFNGSEFFFGSLIVSVIVMIFYYYRAVKQTGLPLKWWFFWLFCLAIAISLQLTVVFKIINF